MNHIAFAPTPATRASSRQTGPVAQGAPKIKGQIKERYRKVKGEKEPIKGEIKPQLRGKKTYKKFRGEKNHQGGKRTP